MRLVPLLLILGACGSSVDVLTNRQTEVDLLDLYDVGTFPVGRPAVVTFEAAVGPRAVPAELSLLGITGGGRESFFTVSEWESANPEPGFQLPDGIAGWRANEQTIDKGSMLDIPLVYYPRREGFDEVRIQLAVEGVDAPYRTAVRAQAALPSVQLRPMLIDFGGVPVGTEAMEEIVVSNEGEIEAGVSLGAAQGLAFRTRMPLVVPAHEERVISIAYEALDLGPLDVLLPVRLGDQSIGIEVRVRANACRGGDPNVYNRDGDGYSICNGDCDDDDPDVYPGAVEVENGSDDNCNGVRDEGTAVSDDDGDGFCESLVACVDGALPGDCHDNDALRSPDLVEDCPAEFDPRCHDGVDNNCDGIVDSGAIDEDGDGYTVAGGDCAPFDATRFPGALEIPNDLDDDCDGIADEGTVWFDDDGDGFCEGTGVSPPRCTKGRVGMLPGDCDDRVDPNLPWGPHPGAMTFPGADERLERYVDNDCDGLIDEGTPWADNDGDGYIGDAGDCDDSNPLVGPHVEEIPGNGVDDDCNVNTPDEPEARRNKTDR